MTRRDIEKINRRRLAGWEAQMTANHLTAMVAIAVGHDHASERIELFIPVGEHINLEAVEGLLAHSLKAIQEERLKQS